MGCVIQRSFSDHNSYVECCSLNLLAGTEELGMVKYFTNYFVFYLDISKIVWPFSGIFYGDSTFGCFQIWSESGQWLSAIFTSTLMLFYPLNPPFNFL